MSEITRERVEEIVAEGDKFESLVNVHDPNARWNYDPEKTNLARLALRLWDDVADRAVTEEQQKRSIARLTRERDEARKANAYHADQLQNEREYVESLREDRKTAEAEVARLRAALRKARAYIEPRVIGRKGGQSHGETVVLPIIDAALAPAAAAPEATCHSCGHIESAHLHEIHEGARWCDVHECPCPNYAALAPADEPAETHIPYEVRREIADAEGGEESLLKMFDAPAEEPATPEGTITLRLFPGGHVECTCPNCQFPELKDG